jgi:CTP synthase
MDSSKTKYIFVCGGVLSGIGKGVTTASIGLLLKNHGFTVGAVKIDPYISLDAGTMRPQEHGEVFVTTDGGEIDMDLGNYERFLDEDFTKDHNITTGKVYAQVIDNERKFFYQGRDAEVIPDVINEIKRRIYKVSEGKDFVMVEIGGTVGDIENMPFLIAAREMERENPCAYIMLTYLPLLKTVGELKTKPTQHAVMLLRQEGINPDFIITRAEERVDDPRLETIAKRCFVEKDRIFDVPDQDSIYKVPRILKDQNLADSLLKFFNIEPKDSTGELYSRWDKYSEYFLSNGRPHVKIGLVGKYVKHGSHEHLDTYISVVEALKHAGFANDVKVDLEMISAEDLNEENYIDKLKYFNGIVIPQGWGSRGYEGKLLAIKYCRENNIPYLGLCYGMQMAVIEFSRNILGIKDANSEEIDSGTLNKVIHLMEEQKKHMQDGIFGGTIRLGDWPCKLVPGTKTYSIYESANQNLQTTEIFTEEGAVQQANKLTSQPANPPSLKLRGAGSQSEHLTISERHRHRYEFNNDYKERLEKAGLKVSGTSPDGLLVEMIELVNHKFFIGTQAHPEYKSRPLRPHPLFVEFVKKSVE